MKFHEAIEIVRNRRILSEEEDFDDVIDKDDLSKDLEEATKAIEKDLLKLRSVVENKTITHLYWTNLASKKYLTAFDNFYNFADGCAKLIRRRELCDRAATPTIKAALLKRAKQEGHNVDSEAGLKIAAKSLLIYQNLVKDVDEITKLIRQYNEFDFVKRNRWQMNIPETEFHFRLRRLVV